MSRIVDEALSLIEVTGALQKYAGDPIDENPYDPDKFRDAHDAWNRGWKSVRPEGKVQNCQA